MGQMWWGDKCDDGSNVMRGQMWWWVKCDEGTNVMMGQMWWGVKCDEGSKYLGENAAVVLVETFEGTIKTFEVVVHSSIIDFTGSYYPWQSRR